MNKVVDSLRAVDDMVRYRTSQKSRQSFDDLLIVSNQHSERGLVKAHSQRT